MNCNRKFLIIPSSTLQKASSVREALEILVTRDQLVGYTCSRTNQEVTAWQQCAIEDLPIVMIMHLKWFDYKKETATKVIKNFEFPVELKIDSSKFFSLKFSYTFN